MRSYLIVAVLSGLFAACALCGFPHQAPTQRSYYRFYKALGFCPTSPSTFTRFAFTNVKLRVFLYPGARDLICSVARITAPHHIDTSRIILNRESDPTGVSCKLVLSIKWRANSGTSWIDNCCTATLNHTITVGYTNYKFRSEGEALTVTCGVGQAPSYDLPIMDMCRQKFPQEVSHGCELYLAQIDAKPWDEPMPPPIIED